MAQRTKERGFTLVEMIVAVALFSIVMVVCVATLLSLVNANRKAQALQSVMNNLNVTVDGMARAIRQGHTYHCGSVTPITSPRDCSSNGDNQMIVFEAYGGDRNNALNQIVYKLDTVNNQILKSTDSGQNYVAVTSPEVTIDDLRFYVIGSTVGDTSQPTVIITVKGTAGSSNVKTTTSFHIQVSAVQRLLDL